MTTTLPGRDDGVDRRRAALVSTTCVAPAAMTVRTGCTTSSALRAFVEVHATRDERDVAAADLDE